MTTYRKNELWSYHCTKSSQSIVNTISYISENIVCSVVEYWLNSIKIDLEEENENKKTFVFNLGIFMVIAGCLMSSGKYFMDIQDNIS